MASQSDFYYRAFGSAYVVRSLPRTLEMDWAAGHFLVLDARAIGCQILGFWRVLHGGGFKDAVLGFPPRGLR